MSATRSLLLALALLLLPAAARGQEGELRLLHLSARSEAAPADRVQRWRERAAGALGGAAAREALAGELAATFPPARLEEVEALAALLARARERSAALEEAEALRLLSRAERLLVRNADLPGLASYYVELQLGRAIAAAQMGEAALAEDALRRAAAVDPQRGLRAAEAPPDLVARARAIAQRSRTAPEGRFRVEADAAGARVFLDDRALGEAPLTARAAPGPHLLRVEAPGRRAFGQLIDVFAGDRAPLRIALSPHPAREELAQIEAHAREARLGALPGALGALAAHALRPTLWVLEVGAGDRDRALLSVCREAGCGGPLRLSPDRPLPGPEARPPAASLAEARRWLASVPAGPIALPVRPQLWEQWYLWVALGAALVLGSVALGVALGAGQPAPALRLRVDPGDTASP